MPAFMAIRAWQEDAHKQRRLWVLAFLAWISHLSLVTMAGPFWATAVAAGTSGAGI